MSDEQKNAAVLILSLLGLALLLAVVTSAKEVPLRSGGVVVVNATPQAIGEHVGRRELIFKNDGASTVVCGHDLATLSATPGAGSGASYAAGEGISICDFADQELYCMSVDGTDASISYDESYMRTPTATATATATS